jgi:hypothetical protein
MDKECAFTGEGWDIGTPFFVENLKRGRLGSLYVDRRII